MEWISVEIKLPSIGDKILCAWESCVDVFYVIKAEYNHKEDADSEGYNSLVVSRKKSNYDGFDIVDTNYITHWMPLPNPPNHLEE